MTIRDLPEISAFDPPAGLEWHLPKEVLDKWPADIHAADVTDDNTISLFGMIGRDPFAEVDNSDRRVAAALRKIGKREVTVHINSPGGDFFQGMAIYNLLRDHPAKVTVKVMGMAGSSASLVAMAGDEIQIGASAFIMVHNASGVVLGNKHDMTAVAELLTEIDASMATVYAARAGVAEAKAAEWMDRHVGGGTMFRGKEAIRVGLADDVLPADQVAADAAGDLKTVKAVIIVENALMATGKSRSERRSLIAELKGGTPRAATTPKPGAGSKDMADMRSLIETLTT